MKSRINWQINCDKGDVNLNLYVYFQKYRFIYLKLLIVHYQQMNRSRKTQIMERAVLNSILPFAQTNPDWTKKLNQLGRITTINFSQSKVVKERKPKCPECGRAYENFLLLFLHLELTHAETIWVTKYQFYEENVTINLCKRSTTNQDHLFLVGSGQNHRIISSLAERVKNIMKQIFAKFTNKKDKAKRVYFHSTDIFREVGSSSQDEDSECEIGQIERQLERMRISDFSDVNDDEKNIFMLWNNAIYNIKKGGEVIDHIEIKRILKQFAGNAKRMQIKRLSIVMHAWTLWSIGKITAADVSQFLIDYDSANQ